ncbi:MAG: HEAT repeat domain-containing protein [Gloeotrichia echinulata IR180]
MNWHSREGNLPDTQAGLYQQFVDDFDQWKRETLPKISPTRKQELNKKLGELAKVAIDKEATRFRLRQEFVTQYLGEDNHEDSLLNLALNLGWLNQVGRDADRKPVYAFFHASFQEYFAAQAIDDWHFFVNHVPENPEQGTYRIFEPQWKQTILLWLGRKNLGKEKKDAFIQALVTFKDGCGIWMWQDVDKGFYDYRAYFLAAAGIAEFRDCSRTDEIVNQIVTRGFGKFKTVIENEARTALKQTDRRKAIAALEKLLNSTTVDDRTRWRAAYSLGEIDPGNPQAIAALEKLLNSTTVDDKTRLLAVDSLGEIGTGNPQAIAALVKLLNSTTVDDATLWLAAYSLGKIDPGNPEAIAALVNLLNSTTVDDRTRWRAAYSLGEIGTGNPQAIAALVNLLNSTTVDEDTRTLAAFSLGQIDPGNQQAIAALVNLLNSTTVDDQTRTGAAESLGEIGTGNPQAIAALMKLLNSTTVDDETRRLAAQSLRKIGSPDEVVKAFYEVVKALSGSWLWSDDEYDFTWECAQNLPYPKFYQAWHESHLINAATKNLMRFFRWVTTPFEV